MSPLATRRVHPVICFACGYEAGTFDPCPECGAIRKYFDLPRDIDPDRFRSAWWRFAIENCTALVLFGGLPLLMDFFGGNGLMSYTNQGIVWMGCGVAMGTIVALRITVNPSAMLLGAYRRIVIDTLIMIGALGAAATGYELWRTGGGGGPLLAASSITVGVMPFVHVSACTGAIRRFEGYAARRKLQIYQIAIFLTVLPAIALFIPGVALAFNQSFGGAGLSGTGVGMVGALLLLGFAFITMKSGFAAGRPHASRTQ